MTLYDSINAEGFAIRSERPLKNPIVLVHGLGATGSFVVFDYFLGLRAHLARLGYEIHVAHLSPWQGIEHRAAELKRQLEAMNAPRYNIIAHSLGGLDSRYLISQLGFASRIASLTTIGTTHRGSYLAELITQRGAPVYGALNRALGLLGWSARALAQVTPKYCRGEFADATPNHPDVAYFSAPTAIARPVVSNSLPIFWLTHGLLARSEGDNDGFVSVASASWGEVLFTEAGDHYAQIGHGFGRISRNGLNHLEFYERIIERLRGAGF